jgi:undecaprenyl-phosphate 4-deoxy-4-formamido-L-arabinose transferase
MMKKVSFVIPCYNSSQTIGKVIDEIKDTMEKIAKYRYEIILVNDCSPDNTFEVIEKLCKENTNICGKNYVF